MALCVVFVHAGTDDREMYAEYLRTHGFEVIEANTTDEAMSKLGNAHVLITGLMVPGSVKPIELVERTRHESHGAPTPIVVLTAVTSVPVLEAVRRAGADAVLIKPCYPADLLNDLHRVLEKHGIRDIGDGVYLVPVADRRSSPRSR